jgi:hypothetical protein
MNMCFIANKLSVNFPTKFIEVLTNNEKVTNMHISCYDQFKYKGTYPKQLLDF